MTHKTAHLGEFDIQPTVDNMLGSDASMTFEEYKNALTKQTIGETEKRRQKIVAAFEYADQNRMPQDPYKEIRVAHYMD